MSEKIERVLQRLRDELECAKRLRDEAIEKIKEDPVYAMQWDQHEKAAVNHMEVNWIENFIVMIESLESEEKIVLAMRKGVDSDTERLVGSGGYGHSSGPWERNSTSLGSNRCAIIEANNLRWKIRTMQMIADKLEL